MHLPIHLNITIEGHVIGNCIHMITIEMGVVQFIIIINIMVDIKTSLVIIKMALIIIIMVIVVFIMAITIIV